MAGLSDELCDVFVTFFDSVHSMNTVILCDMHVQCVCFLLFETRMNAIFSHDAEIFPGHTPFILASSFNNYVHNNHNT